MIDEIFKKLYNNKRYIPVLEALDYGSKSMNQVENAFEDFKKSLEQFRSGNSVFMSYEGTRLVCYKSFGVVTDVLENQNDVDEALKSIVEPIYKENNITITEDNPLNFQIVRQNTGTILSICLTQRLVFDYVRLLTYTDLPVFYEFSINTLGNNFETTVFSNLRVRPRMIQDVIQSVDNKKAKMLDDLAISTQVSGKTNEEYKVEPPDISFDSNPCSNPYITFATTKGSDKQICFRLLTSQMVADERPRDVSNNTKMIETSILNIKQNLANPDYTEKAKAIHYSKNDFDDNIEISEAIIEPKKRGRPVGGGMKRESGAYTIMKNNSGEENREIINRAISLCNAYYNAVDNASKGVYDKDYEESNGLNADLQVYLPEILSPYALIFNACKWARLGRTDGFKTLQNVVKSKGNNFTDVDCYFGFYTSSTNELADSFAWINGKFIFISTKAGANGKGASASIESLKQFIYAKDKEGNYTDELTDKGDELKRVFPLEFDLFNYLCNNRKATAVSVVQFLNSKGVKYPSKSVKAADVTRFLHTDTKMSDFIIECLQSASFDFIQMNAKPTSTEGDFHFNFTATYPAVFDGKVDIEFASTSGTGSTKFHIV